jgi:hypothetical protein
MPAKFSRFRSKVVKVLDNYYFKEMHGAELKKHLDKACEIRNDITTMQGIEELLAQHQNLNMPDEGLQWQLWIFPNVGDETIICMKIRHVMADGLALILVMAMLQDEFDHSIMIQTNQALNCCSRFGLLLLKPFTLLYAAIFFTLWSTDENVIKPKEFNLAGQKNNAITMPFDLNVLKKIAKSHNGTVNDVVLSMLAVSMREYIRSKDDLDTKSINLLMPFSLRALPKNVAEHTVENDFSALCFTLQLKENFEVCMQQIRKQSSSLRKSLYPYGVNSLTQFIAWFPGIVGQLMMMWVVSKATFAFSNVPGPKKPLDYGNGAKAHGCFALIPGLGDLAFGISAISLD